MEQEQELNTPPKPCVICGIELECAVNNWDTWQPYGGGQINLSFGYGSCEHDHQFAPSSFNGVICDICARSLIQRMEPVIYRPSPQKGT